MKVGLGLKEFFVMCMFVDGYFCIFIGNYVIFLKSGFLGNVGRFMNDLVLLNLVIKRNGD